MLFRSARLSGPIGMIADAKSLKDHGVERMVYLEPGRMSAEQPSLVYLVTPRCASRVFRASTHIKSRVDNMQCIAEHVRWIKGKGAGPTAKRFYVFFVSRETLICKRALEHFGVSADVSIGEFQLDLIPFDDDVLSLEQEFAFRECTLVRRSPRSLRVGLIEIL